MRRFSCIAVYAAALVLAKVEYAAAECADSSWQCITSTAQKIHAVGRAIQNVTVNIETVSNVNYMTDELTFNWTLSNESSLISGHRLGYCVYVQVEDGPEASECVNGEIRTRAGMFQGKITVGPVGRHPDTRWNRRRTNLDVRMRYGPQPTVWATGRWSSNFRDRLVTYVSSK